MIRSPAREAGAIGLALCAGLLCAMSAGSTDAADADLTPETILRFADRARGNLDGAEWTVDVTAEEGGRVSREQLQVQAAGADVLAVTTEPANRRGNTLLVQEGKVWFHKPGLSRPVPISQRQRLLGLASYGDISTTDYAGQYTAQALPDAEVDGIPCHVFDLRAAARGLLYERIVWWVSKADRVGLRADYYTLSGKLIKSARLSYDHRIEMEDGTLQPFCSRIVITEELVSADRTTLALSEPRIGPIPHTVFNVNRMGR